MTSSDDLDDRRTRRVSQANADTALPESPPASAADPGPGSAQSAAPGARRNWTERLAQRLDWTQRPDWVQRLRRPLTIGLVVLVVGALVAWAVAWIAEPRVLVELEQRLSAELGAEVEVGDLAVDDGSLVFRDLRIDGDARGELMIEEMAVRGGLRALMRRQDGALAGATLRGVRVVVPLDRASPVVDIGGRREPEDSAGPPPASGRGESAASASEGDAESDARSPEGGGAGIADRLAQAERMLRLMAEDATIDLVDVTVVGRRADGRADDEIELLTDLAASITRGSGGVLYTWGRGRTAQGRSALAAAAPSGLVETSAPVDVPGSHAARPASSKRGELSWRAEIDPGTLEVKATAGLAGVPLATFLPILPGLPWHRPEDTLVDGSLELAAVELAARSDEVPFRGELMLRGIGLDSERIAEAPVVTDVGFSGRGTWSPSDRRLEVTESTVRLGEAAIGLRAEVSPERLAVRAELPSTPCSEVVRAVPETVLAAASRFRWQGSMRAGLSLDLPWSSPSDTELDIAVDEGCDFVAAPEGALPEHFDGPFVHSILLADGSEAELVTGPGSESWTPVGEIAPTLVWAVLAHEDPAFFRHEGFAPWAIETALQRNLEEERFAYGASTITMQLAKNLFLVRDKTLARKLREAVFTWWLEERFSKTQILELYFNVIEYGPGIYGIRDAARHYFGVRPDELSLGESLFLANLLPAPRDYHRQYEAGSVSQSTRSAMNHLLGRMAEKGWIDKPGHFRGLAEVQSIRFHRDGEARPRGRLRPRVWTAPLPLAGTAGDDAEPRLILSRPS